MRNTKHSIYTSLISLLLCISMLLGTTFAWFTDIVSSNGNVIQSGNLQAQMFYSDTFLDENDAGWKNASDEAVFTHNNWEPGYTDLKYVKIYNDGSLNFKWKLTVEADGPVTELADVIDVYYVNPATNEITSLAGLDSVGTLTKVMSEKTNNTGRLTPGQSAILAIAFHMQESAGNNYQNKSLCDNGFSLKLIATQDVGENDSFGDDYDAGADWDEGTKNFSASAPLSQVPIIYGAIAGNITIGGENGMNAYIPSGVKIAEGAESLDLAINTVDGNDNLTLDDGDSAVNMDVHIYGVAADNTVPMIVNLGAILPSQLDATEVKLYHTENGTPVQMTRVASADDFAVHNQFTYDPATGEVSIYVATFSVFSAVKTNADEWDGKSDTSWYNENDTEFTLTTAEQFAGFRDLVDGGNTFEGKTVKLDTDIDLAKIPFDPIGYNYENKGGQVFKGTFDGQNHTVYNLYQNCWELDPDKTNYGTYTYSTAGGGLFASIVNSTIKNIAISGAEVVFECIDMGILVGYAQGECHFENIIIANSKIANYNRYTGGVVGEVSYGVDNNGDSYSHTFKNITVDSTVKVCGLWGSFGCGMGGVIGGKWGDATVKMENVISAPVMDVYNDVVSAYQWYAFRGCGMLIGHTEEPYSDGRHSGIATAGFLTCENVKVYYGDWVNYTYYQFANQTDAEGNRLWYSDYPWVRAEAGEYCDAFSNIRYGIPLINGVKVTEMSEEEFNVAVTGYTEIIFDQLYGADRGMYGQAAHEGVTVIKNLGETKTIYILNDQNWEDLKLHYWYRNGDDTWTNISENGVSMDAFETAVNNVYKLTLPSYVDGFKITADDENEVTFILDELTDGNTYDLSGEPVYVASVNGTQYSTLADAIANANGGTVTLIDNVVLHESIVIENQSVTLDLNGKTISVADNSEIVEVLLVKGENANVIITGNGTMLATGEDEYVEHVEVISAIDGAIVTIQNGTFISDGCTAIYATRGAKVHIFDGHFEAKTPYYGRYFTIDVNEKEDNCGKITVYGGTYVNFDPANHTTDGINSINKLANSCLSTSYDVNTKTYKVVANHNFDNDGYCTCGCEKNTITLNIKDYATSNSWSNGTQYKTVSLGNGIIATANGGGNTGKYYTSGTNWRLYQSESATLSITSKYIKIASVKISYVSDTNGVLKLNDIINSKDVVQINDYNVIFEIGNNSSATNGQVRITDIEITYMVESHSCAGNEIGATCTKNSTCGICGIEIPDTALGHNLDSNPYKCSNDGCTFVSLPESGSTITIQEALWIAETLENGKETSGKYVISGVIDDNDHPSSTGTTTITSDEYSIYITNIHNVDGTIRHDAFTVKLKDGNTITVSAKIAKNSSGEAQLHETWLTSHTDIDPADHTCDICGATEITDRIDENSDNLCDICGISIGGGSTAPDPEITVEKTVSMDIFANKGTLSNKVISWTSGDVTVSNAQGSATSAIRTTDSDHYRVYKSSNVVISVENATISKVILTCESGYVNGILNGATNAGYDVVVNDTIVTIIASGDVDSIDFIASEQARINKVEVTYTTTNAGNEGGSTEPAHACENVCGTCGKCTNIDCTENVCADKCTGHKPQLEDKKYSYTFTSSQYSANGTKALNGKNWTLSGDGGYWGYDGTKGQQFGSSNKPYKSMTLTSDEFSNVSKITINTSGATDIKGSCNIYVGNVLVGTITLTKTATAYSFDVTGLTGEVRFEFTQTSSKAFYIKSIEVEYAE